jgi:hypothetical protein
MQCPTVGERGGSRQIERPIAIHHRPPVATGGLGPTIGADAATPRRT